MSVVVVVVVVNPLIIIMYLYYCSHFSLYPSDVPCVKIYVLLCNRLYMYCLYNHFYVSNPNALAILYIVMVMPIKLLLNLNLNCERKRERERESICNCVYNLWVNIGIEHWYVPNMCQTPYQTLHA